MSEEKINPIELPRNLPKDSRLGSILGSFYDSNKNKQWFHRAELIAKHSTHMKPTLEIYCEYNPTFELKEIRQFCDFNQIAFEIINLSNV